MVRVNNIKIKPDYTDAELKKAVAKKLRISASNIKSLSIFKRSLDARDKSDIRYVITADAEIEGNEKKLIKSNKDASEASYPIYTMPEKVRMEKRPVVVGFGPAGMFAAYILAHAGTKPIVLERGECVEKRMESVNHFWKTGDLKENSNVQFGEGGAGTFSDGKLNTGIKDPRIRKVLETFVEKGAPEDILYDAKPHIGTDRLPETVKNIREEIVSLGGEVLFESTFTGLKIENGSLASISYTDSEGSNKDIETNDVVIALGHSSRDTFKMLYDSGLVMEQKPFAVGVRIEHLAEDINISQLGEHYHDWDLPTADYKLSTHLEDGRGVYSFCMCPGGEVVGATSIKGHVVTNGMSNNSRDGKNSNAAILVGLNPEDFNSDDVFAGMNFQEELEKKAYIIGGESYHAPAQRQEDFMLKRKTESFGRVNPSYQPGVTPSNIWDVLPELVCSSIAEALPHFAKKIKGFDDPDAVLTAPETRSSSPVRIKRDIDGQAIGIKGIYPCGEGAGYAGGITSAAVDGIKIAESILKKYE
ncbi:MAG: hypothetical protein Q4C42_06080 [Clostridia bacterium]|nr:hypothetical protein [Clostridia bacterium]